MNVGVCMILVGSATSGIHAPANVDHKTSHAEDASQPIPAKPQPAGNSGDEEEDMLDMNGNPLPPEIQQQIREQMKSLPKRQPSNNSKDSEITVSGQRLRGSVQGDTPPERTLNPDDIKAYGAGNIEELLQKLGAQVGIIPGRTDSFPVVLLNGRRLSSFSEISTVPSEAIERMEVFPEEVALRYGFRSDQKTVNIVMYEKFHQITGRASTVVPTEGGTDTKSGEADYFAIRNDTRYSFNSSYTRSGQLLESERNLIQISGQPDDGQFRSLISKQERLTLSGVASGLLPYDISFAVSGGFGTGNANALLGLFSDRAIERHQATNSARMGLTLNGRAGKWQWSMISGYDWSNAKTTTDAGINVGNKVRLTNCLADTNFILSGPVLQLPAGPLSANVQGTYAFQSLNSNTLGFSGEQETKLSRDQIAVQANLDIPIISSRIKDSFVPGNLSANFNLGAERLSDFRSLRNLGYGINWWPSQFLNFRASAKDEQSAPTLDQLDGPSVVTPGTRSFDYRNGVVDITDISGGNLNLRAEKQHTLTLAFYAKPFEKKDLSVSVEYIATRTKDPIAQLQMISPETEAAFPSRFLRNINGRLLQIDSSPINFAQSDQRRLRWGINFSQTLGKVLSMLEGASTITISNSDDIQASLPPGAIVIMQAPDSEFGKGLETKESRVFLSLYHNWILKDSLTLRSGLPALNLLRGDAFDISNNKGRHQVEFQAGASRKGLGIRIAGNWQSGAIFRDQTSIFGSLRMSNLATFNISFFSNLADSLGDLAPRWFKGMRVSAEVNNIFNTRQKIQNNDGITPLTYQPKYLDPLGRVIKISLRKTF